jgi:hypothetical protein
MEKVNKKPKFAHLALASKENYNYETKREVKLMKLRIILSDLFFLLG